MKNVFETMMWLVNEYKYFIFGYWFGIIMTVVFFMLGD